MKNRAGETITVLSGAAAYQAYKPNKLPPFPEIELDEELVLMLAKAHNLLGRLDAQADYIPDKELLLGAYVRKEALLSSQIEGTQATLEDIFSPTVDVAVNLDVDDVVNYVNALNFAIEKTKELPICTRLLCLTHEVLLQGVRGQEKNTGELRKSQNWIGSANSTISTARYVPPTVSDMTQAMGDLEKFINEYEMDTLLKTALVHYQFETIHPFLDGNGRIGRMLITLMLLDSKELSTPIFYMSLFLKSNRTEYYDRLRQVRVKGDYEQWIKFFLTGVIETCNDCIDTIGQITRQVNEDARLISGAKATVLTVYKYSMEQPIFEIKRAASALGLSYNTVAGAVKVLVNCGILSEKTAKVRNRIFEYTAYLDVLKSGT